ncbi:NCS2 family permease [Streptomyces albus subsp. chlorinus]|uniref:NCS2 family permease n=1 Tax=Streptomyces albus TaxID=1888 RepID=UPI001571140E|nr:NCS2 family permease [Streptomyces albus]NSC25620.1 NCS2 family permease [Streptomyces albus subsp. chlorinus]
METETALEGKSGDTSRIDRIFRLRERGTSVRREVLAGVSMFLASAYVVVVVPGMLTAAGVPHAVATTAVIVSTVLATVFMGLYANLPFVLAPGLGGVALVAVTLIQHAHVPYPVAMGMVFWSGVAFLLLTLLGVRQLVTRVIPDCVRLAIGSGIGLYIAMLGFRSAGLIDFGPTGMKLGDLGSAAGLLALAGLVLVTALSSRKVPGALLITMAVLTVAAVPLGVAELPDSWFELPGGLGPVAFHVDLLGALKPAYLPYLFALFAAEFFSTTGVVMAVGERIGLADDKGQIPSLNKPFLVDSVSVIGGSAVGGPSMTTYLESAAGSDSGGRTGLTSVVTGGLFSVLLLFTPLATMIPSAATAPVLIFIGMSMLAGLRKIDMSDPTDGIPAALVVAATLFWGNFGTGIAAGLTGYVLIKAAAGRFKEIHVGLWIMLPFLLYFFVNSVH